MSSPENVTPLPTPLSPWQVAGYFLAGNLLPAVAMLVFVRSNDTPTWQSNSVHDYAALLMTGASAAVFCPLLVYSIACFTLALLRPQVAANSFVVRLGSHTGIILGLHFGILSSIRLLTYLDGGVGLAIWSVVTLVAVLVTWNWLRIADACCWLSRQIAGTQIGMVITMFVLPLVAIVLASTLTSDQVGSFTVLIIFGPGLVLLALAPAWFLVANLAMSLRIQRLRAAKFQFQIWQLLAWTSWLAAYCAAWRFAVETAMTEYAALPVEPPSGKCAVSAATAGGHQAVTAWREVRDAAGQPFRISMQLAYLKCGEIALWTTCPGVHRIVRGIYDCVGPGLVPVLRNPWAADIACLALKPLEWGTRLILSPVVHNLSVIAAALYE